jgi:hypothetical protein
MGLRRCNRRNLWRLRGKKNIDVLEEMVLEGAEQKTADVGSLGNEHNQFWN